MTDSVSPCSNPTGSASHRTNALSPRQLCGRARAGSTSSALPLSLTLSTLRTGSVRARAHTEIPSSPDSPAPETPVRPRDMLDSLAYKHRPLPTADHTQHMADVPAPSATDDMKASSTQTPPRRHFASLFITSPMQPIPALPTPVLSGGTFAVSCARAALPDANRRRKYLLPLVFLAVIFAATAVPVVWGVMSLPIRSLNGMPTTLQQVALLGRDLQAYADSGFSGKAHVLGVLSIVRYLVKCVINSVVLNVLAGALLSPALGTLLMTVLTTIGSVCSSLLSAPLTPLVRRFVPRPLHLVRQALEGHDESTETDPITEKPIVVAQPADTQHNKSPTWVRLTIMRLVGVVPWSGINIACGVCEVPLTACAVGAFFGTLPWTAVTCQPRGFWRHDTARGNDVTLDDCQISRAFPPVTWACSSTRSTRRALDIQHPIMRIAQPAAIREDRPYHWRGRTRKEPLEVVSQALAKVIGIRSRGSVLE
ncbi:SNARE associated domain-containing protein [Rhizoctonia solani AG-1 IA]|uniref:SNARE associated domain-containing protein n=1 Tax=Thanatephorus cucumeris (strain AG1-IA) TaxID=983506 RepID=L8WHQ7_THACA|nr:SNARE associated domain-containing protein [Rhizoctonia solani AG-1 IA]